MAKTFFDRLVDLADERLEPELRTRIDALPKTNLGDFGVDPFGFDPEILKIVAPIANFFYRQYFRCETHHLDRIPKGRFMMVANHSGQIPFDAFMIGSALLLDSEEPRMLRGMVERWSAELPFVSTLFNRSGQFVGSPAIGRKLLEMDECLLVFPEGVRGINKMFSERYKLQRFGHGFLRLALQTKSPIIPVAVVGAEEQAPAVTDLKPIAKIFGFPSFPLVLPQIAPLPLPVKYHIWVGEPLCFEGDGTEDDELIAAQVMQVKDTIQHMLNQGVRRREYIFF